MRHFNTYGPVNTDEHFVVPRDALVTEMVSLIEQGNYFTLYAPRQMGKTTLLRRLTSIVEETPGYLSISLSFEAFEGWSVADFLKSFCLDLNREIEAHGSTAASPGPLDIQQHLAQRVPDSFFALREYFLDLYHMLAPQRLVLMIDEFDSTPPEAIAQLLQLWRQIYLSPPSPRSLHSVALIGLQNIATLNLGRSSPFHIARQIEVSVFSCAEIQLLFQQYTAETDRGRHHRHSPANRWTAVPGQSPGSHVDDSAGFGPQRQDHSRTCQYRRQDARHRAQLQLRNAYSAGKPIS